MLLITAVLTALALRGLLKRADRNGVAAPDPEAIFVKNDVAQAVVERGETVLNLPQQREGLALNPVAARCWELIDGRRNLRTIATLIAAEHEVSVGTALDDVRSFAVRLRREFLAMPAGDWEFAHTHVSDLFAGCRDDGITEVRRSGTVVHFVDDVAGADGGVDASRLKPHVWPFGTWVSRRQQRALATWATHLRREAPLCEAMRAFDMGWKHSCRGRLVDAERSFLEASRLVPGWINPHYQLGHVHLRGRDYAQAIREFTTTETISPGYFMVREYLDLARKMADGEVSFEAFHLLERAAAVESGDPDLVITLCRRALQLSPEFPSAHLVLARAYARKTQYDRALAELRHAIDNEPDTATLCNTLFARGSIFMAQGMTEEAMWEFDKVIELNGSSWATQSAMAHLAGSSSVH